MSANHRHRTSFAMGAVLVGAWLAGAGCLTMPRPVPARVRRADYDATRPQLTSDVARAMDAGHVLPGMDTRQVWVVLGDPARKTRFERSQTDIWLYRAHSVQQEHYRLGTQGMCLVFVKDRLVAIEPM